MPSASVGRRMLVGWVLNSKLVAILYLAFWLEARLPVL